MVSARQAGDMSFTLTAWSAGITPSDFNLPWGSADSAAVAHTVFDRPLSARRDGVDEALSSGALVGWSARGRARAPPGRGHRHASRQRAALHAAARVRRRRHRRVHLEDPARGTARRVRREPARARGRRRRVAAARERSLPRRGIPRAEHARHHPAACGAADRGAQRTARSVRRIPERRRRGGRRGEAAHAGRTAHGGVSATSRTSPSAATTSRKASPIRRKATMPSGCTACSSGVTAPNRKPADLRAARRCSRSRSTVAARCVPPCRICPRSRARRASSPSSNTRTPTASGSRAPRAFPCGLRR